MSESQTTTVELDPELAERARREAERRGITLGELVEQALRRFLAAEVAMEPTAHEVERRRAAAERMRGMFADDSGRSMADELIADRRAEVRAEDREDEIRQRRR